MTTKDYNKMLYKQANSFIYGLVGGGIPRKAIATNDFSSNSNPSVYITIPYGKKNGGTYKRYSRWSNYDLLNALRWWNDNK